MSMFAERFTFRGIRLDNKNWVYGHLCWTLRNERGQQNVYPAIQHQQEKGWYVPAPVALESIGQCTGIAAKKSYRGKEPHELLIYEGDFVVFFSHINGRLVKLKGVVVWLEGTWCARKENNVHYCLGEVQYNRDIESVGNIHDTPTLLINHTEGGA